MKLFELAPPPPRLKRRAHQDGWSRTLTLLVRLLWAWRVELTLIGLGLVVWNWLTSEVPTVWQMPLAAPLALFFFAPGPGKRWLVRALHRASVRRRWARACRHANLETFNERVPRIRRHRFVTAGDELRVRVPAGQCVPDIEAKTEVLAAMLKLREVRVLRDEDNAKQATVTLVCRDPLAGTLTVDWPHTHADRLSLWQPIPVGIDENGQPVTIGLPERNLLIGGEPGAGKSVAESMPVATAALDPDADLTLFDGKLVELAVWRNCARAFVGPDVDEAIDVLRGLHRELSERVTWLLDTSAGKVKRKIEPGDGLRLHLVACDELGFYLNPEDRHARAEIRRLFIDLVQRGRAVGIIVVAATQKPSADVIPTALRDLFGFRWALRCSTRDASDTVLGAGWATRSYNAATIAGNQRGVGWLLAEDGLPLRLRSYYLTDSHHLETLAARARRLRDIRPGEVIDLAEQRKRTGSVDGEGAA